MFRSVRFVPKADIALQQIFLFDHFVGAAQQRDRPDKAECPGGSVDVRRDANSPMPSRYRRLSDTLAPPRQKLSVDREREWMVAAEKHRPHYVRPKAPNSVLTARAVAANIGDQARRGRTPHRRRAVRSKQAECRHKTCVVVICREDLQVEEVRPV